MIENLSMIACSLKSWGASSHTGQVAFAGMVVRYGRPLYQLGKENWLFRVPYTYTITPYSAILWYERCAKVF